MLGKKIKLMYVIRFVFLKNQYFGQYVRTKRQIHQVEQTILK